MYPKTFTLAATLLLSFISTAQTVIYTSAEYDATPRNVISNNSCSMFSGGYTRSLHRAIVYTGPAEAVMLYSHKKREETNVIKINSEAKIIWETKVLDDVLFVGLHNNAVIVLTVPDWNDDDYNAAILNSVKAILIDPSKGTIISEKTIWQAKPDVYIDPKVLSTQNGIFKGLLMRYTEADQKKYKSASKSYQAKSHTRKMEWIYYNESLDPSIKIINSNAAQQEFLGCDINNKGELFIISCSNSAVVAEKFNTATTSAVSRSVTYYDAHEEAQKQGYVIGNPANDEQVSLTMRYRNNYKGYSLLTANFDMAASKGYNNAVELNKDYGQQLGIKYPEDLDAISLLFYNDRLVVVKEVQSLSLGDGRTANRYYRYQTVVSVYDKQMKLVKDIVIPRQLELFVPGQMDGTYHIDKNILTALYSNDGGIGKNATKMATINMDELTLLSNEVITREPIKKTPLIQAESVLWFNNSLVLPYIVENGFGSKNDRTVFQAIRLGK